MSGSCICRTNTLFPLIAGCRNLCRPSLGFSLIWMEVGMLRPEESEMREWKTSGDNILANIDKRSTEMSRCPGNDGVLTVTVDELMGKGCCNGHDSGSQIQG